MLEKRKRYTLVKFPPQVLREAYRVFCGTLKEKNKSATLTSLSVEYGDEEWELDTAEEFYSEYRKDVTSASFWHYHGSCKFLVTYNKSWTTASIVLPTKNEIETVFGVLNENYEQYKVSEETARESVRQRVRVFIGHGRSDQWRDLKDHLQDKHDFNVVAYETGVRAGYTVSEVLQEMSEQASIAFLVYTGEDLDKKGSFHPRENVIHETGLFQGKLGLKRSIVLIEEGCSEFTNIDGLQQLRFSKGNIKEIFGDVVATIYREFGAEAGE